MFEDKFKVWSISQKIIIKKFEVWGKKPKFLGLNICYFLKKFMFKQDL